MYTTIQKVRERSGFQNYKVDSALSSTGDSTIWLNRAKDLLKIVPFQSNGATVSNIYDIEVKITGNSVGISAINSLTGEITLVAGTTSGASVVATFASSPFRNEVVYQYVAEANSYINTYLSGKYSISSLTGACIPLLADLETKVAAGNMLANSYGVVSENSAEDGYKMLEEVEKLITKILEGNANLIDIDGNVISQDVTNQAGGGNASGGIGVRVPGYLFTADQEDFTVEDPDES